MGGDGGRTVRFHGQRLPGEGGGSGALWIGEHALLFPEAGGCTLVHARHGLSRAIPSGLQQKPCDESPSLGRGSHEERGRCEGQRGVPVQDCWCMMGVRGTRREEGGDADPALERCARSQTDSHRGYELPGKRYSQTERDPVSQNPDIRLLQAFHQVLGQTCFFLSGESGAATALFTGVMPLATTLVEATDGRTALCSRQPTQFPEAGPAVGPSEILPKHSKADRQAQPSAQNTRQHWLYNFSMPTTTQHILRTPPKIPTLLTPPRQNAPRHSMARALARPVYHAPIALHYGLAWASLEVPSAGGRFDRHGGVSPQGAEPGGGHGSGWP